MSASLNPLLSVENLTVSFATPDGIVQAVNDVSFQLEAGTTLGIVGESGSGKSVTASSIMRLNSGTTATTTGRIMLNGVDILAASDKEIRAIRGQEAAMVFQDPLSALNPYYTVGEQIAEAYKVHHRGAKSSDVRALVLEMLVKVGIPNPSKRIDEYPHEFSGGMRQRIVIAIALINNPRVLVADEPTTALDVTVQAQILDLMKQVQNEFGTAIILITHDLGVIAEVADDVLVMYAGRAVERASVDVIFESPTHPYTSGLLGAVRSLDHSERGALSTISGSPPSLINIPNGCAFHPRCAVRPPGEDLCTTVVPSLRQVANNQSWSACHLRDEQLVSLRDRSDVA